MSLHRSLKTTAGALNEHRNVLTRAERITKLMEQQRFAPGEQSPIGLVKVANRAVIVKKKKAKEEETAATEIEAPAAES